MKSTDFISSSTSIKPYQSPGGDSHPRTCGRGPPSFATAMLSPGWPTRQRKVKPKSSRCCEAHWMKDVQCFWSVILRSFFFHFVIIWFRYFFKTNCTGIVFGRHVFGVFSMFSPWINVAQAWTFRGVKRQIGDFPVRMASSSYTSMKRQCGSANQLRIW